MHVAGWDDDEKSICLFYCDPPAAGGRWPRSTRKPQSVLLHAGEGKHEALVQWLESNCASVRGRKQQRHG
jgi:hypothetical protein